MMQSFLVHWKKFQVVGFLAYWCHLQCIDFPNRLARLITVSVGWQHKTWAVRNWMELSNLDKTERGPRLVSLPSGHLSFPTAWEKLSMCLAWFPPWFFVYGEILWNLFLLPAAVIAYGAERVCRRYGYIPWLHRAAQSGSLFGVLLCVFCECPHALDRVDQNGKTALERALVYQRWRVIEFLLKIGFDIARYPILARTIWDAALANGQLGVLDSLYPYYPRFFSEQDWRTPYQTALSCRQFRVAAYFLEKQGLCQSREMLIAHAIGDGQLDFLRWLVTEQPGYIHKPAPNGLVPICAAVTAGHGHMVEWLISQGADVHSTNCIQQTPLHLATRARPLQVKLVRLLLQAGADPNARDAEGKTPLHSLLEGYTQHTELAVTDALDDANPQLAVLTCLRDHGACLEAVDHHNRTPLYYAFWYLHPVAAHYLLQTGVQVPRTYLDPDQNAWVSRYLQDMAEMGQSIQQGLLILLVCYQNHGRTFFAQPENLCFQLKNKELFAFLLHNGLVIPSQDTLVDHPLLLHVPVRIREIVLQVAQAVHFLRAYTHDPICRQFLGIVPIASQKREQQFQEKMAYLAQHAEAYRQEIALLYAPARCYAALDHAYIWEIATGTAQKRLVDAWKAERPILPFYRRQMVAHYYDVDCKGQSNQIPCQPEQLSRCINQKIIDQLVWDDASGRVCWKKDPPYGDILRDVDPLPYVFSHIASADGHPWFIQAFYQNPKRIAYLPNLLRDVPVAEARAMIRHLKGAIWSKFVTDYRSQQRIPEWVPVWQEAIVQLGTRYDASYDLMAMWSDLDAICTGDRTLSFQSLLFKHFYPPIWYMQTLFNALVQSSDPDLAIAHSGPVEGPQHAFAGGGKWGALTQALQAQGVPKPGLLALFLKQKGVFKGSGSIIHLPSVRPAP